MTTMTNQTTAATAKRAGSAILMLLFWAYVLIPLTWGVFNTCKKAMALFQ